MKRTILTAALILLTPVLGFTKALDSDARARRVMDQIYNSVVQVEGVNGIGIGGCDPATGVENVRSDFVHCVVIRTETTEAYDYLMGLYPPGTKIQGVFVVLDMSGPTVPQPRISIGG